MGSADPRPPSAGPVPPGPPAAESSPASAESSPASAEPSPASAERRAAGALEAEILAILRAADGPLSPGEVRHRLAPPYQPGGPRGELSYSTVVTIVSRLHAKGLLARQRAGRGFTYTPVNEASLAASRMSQVLSSENDHDAVLSRFVSGLSGRDARLLRELLAGNAGRGTAIPARPGGGTKAVWLLYLPLLVPALAGAAARPLAARLEPRHATWLLTTAAVALAACSLAALALLAAYAVARVPFLAAAGDYSQQVMRRGAPIPAAAGVAAALALTGAAVAVTVMVRNRARALAQSYRRAAGLHAEDGIVVVPGPAIEAYALPGRPGRIVVSGRLLDCLDDRRRAALIAHEQAHLAGRHHLFTTVARLAAAANPLLVPVSRSVDYTVERWADEHAAAVTSDRRLVAETIGQVALLTGPRRRRTAGMVLGIAGSRTPRVSLAWAGPVPRRVAALLTAPPRRQDHPPRGQHGYRRDGRGGRPDRGPGPACPAGARPGIPRLRPAPGSPG